VSFEVERKFVLAGAPPDLDRHPADAIDQGYLAIADDGVEVRVRRRGDRSTLTVKSGPGHVRVEEEIPIEAERFDALWPLTEGRRLVKTRYLVPLDDDLEAEVDVYGEGLEGLVVAEIEFASDTASGDFAPPAWLGREVTGERAYANQTLATRGAPQ
jgi:adenylate cyclase